MQHISTQHKIKWCAEPIHLFVSEINKSTNNVQTVHTVYTQAEPIPTTLAENCNTGN